ncbi:MAG: DUF4446 family protein [Candidatus Nanopelagicales bacterium]|nr:DUF4446 family protein [Candidatus Nanopelagicales bacterium]
MSPVVGAVLGLLALLLSLGAIVLATIANRRWATQSRTSGRDEPPAPVPDDRLHALQAQFDALTGQLDVLRGAVAGAAGAAEAAAALAGAAASRETRDRTALRHVALVRYDAFADVGGRLSHSVAILDDTGSGLVLTTLAGKSDVRTYVRAVSAGAGEAPLSVEEQQAVSAAMAGAPPPAPPAPPETDPTHSDPGPSARVPTVTNGSRT